MRFALHVLKLIESRLRSIVIPSEARDLTVEASNIQFTLHDQSACEDLHFVQDGARMLIVHF
jgi:hypothetical protein